MINIALVTDENAAEYVVTAAEKLRIHFTLAGIAPYLTPAGKLPMIQAQGIVVLAEAGRSPILDRLLEQRGLALPAELAEPGAAWLFTPPGIKDEYDKPAHAVHLLVGAGASGVNAAASALAVDVLGVDPNGFWTGRTPDRFDAAALPALDRIMPAPAFPVIGYFDNDNDELANWRGRRLIIEFEEWKEIIDSLVMMGYNLIDIHDTLGRAEFWNWDYYKRGGEYKADLELADRIIDYAHSRGVAVQVPMYLGWEFHRLPYEKKCLSRFMADWLEVYRHYLDETPLGKADYFLQRPRDPWWDSGYRCCPECDERGVGELMTEMFQGLDALVKARNPEAVLVCDLWAEGREMWRSGEFIPPEDAVLLWADNGWAEYSDWPEEPDRGRFGLYVHAGYYLNHLVQEPHADRLADAIRQGFGRGMNRVCLVNGQSFKNFIFNLEAAARAARDPMGFDHLRFADEWAERCFGKNARDHVIRAFNSLSQAETKALEAGARGFVRQSILFNRLIESAAGGDEPPTGPDLDILGAAAEEADEALAAALRALDLVPDHARNLLHDQVLFPIRLYRQNLECLIATRSWLDRGLDADAVRARAAELYSMLESGGGWDKFSGWYRPENQRVFQPPPPLELIEQALARR